MAPSNTKALRPSSIAAPRGGRPRGNGTGRRARVVPRRACGPPQTPRARAHLGAGQRSPRRRCTPTARKPAPTISNKPVVPRRPRPPASRMTRGPPRSAPSRIQVVLSARSKSQGRQPNSSSPSPATCRESWGRGAATPRRYDLTSASPAFWGRPAPRRGRSERGFRGPPPQHIFGRRPRRRHRPRATAGARRAAKAAHVRPLPLVSTRG